MRVVHFTRRFSPLTETFTYDSIRELERQGVECHVLASERVNPEGRPFPAVEIEPPPSEWDPRSAALRFLSRIGVGAERAASWPTLRTRLRARLRATDPDIVHAHFGPAAVLIAPITARAGVPLVASFYGYDISRLPRDPFWSERYRRLWSRAAAITVLSADMKARVVGLGCPGDRVHVVRLSRDLATMPTRPVPGAIRRFLSVGRLTEKKGHLDTIAAFRRLAESGSDLQLRIIGEGEQRPEIEAYLRAHDLDGRIALLGALDNAEVMREMTAADAFILCSRTTAAGDQEGTPTVFVEAQAVGLPCLGTLHAGVPEMIPRENHWLLAPEGDVEQIAERVLALVRRSPEEVARVVEAGRRKVRADFNLALETAKLRGIYEALVPAHAGGSAGD